MSDSQPASGSVRRKGITDVELKILKEQIDTGDQKLDKTALEGFRKKIIDELGRKDGGNAKRVTRGEIGSDRRLPFNRRQQQVGMRRNIHDQNRRNNFSGRGNRLFALRRNQNTRIREKYVSEY